MKISLFVVLLLVLRPVFSQNINPSLLQSRWSANWITCPDAPTREYGVYHFRKSIDLSTVPSQFVVHVSGDNRYRLFVNGSSVGFGPARSDLMHWNFETYDIAKYLKAGKNVISATVWNMGEHLPFAQFSVQAGFILQGNSATEEIANTNNTWKVTKNTAYKPIPIDHAKMRTFIVVGPSDEVDMSKYPFGFQEITYNDNVWSKAKTLENGMPRGVGSGANWHLSPRMIPLMEETFQLFKEIRRFKGIGDIPDSFLKGASSLTIPANSNVKILLDQLVETTAYPEVVVSGGKGSRVEMTYAEALFDKNRNKGDRQNISEKEIVGYTDVFRPDGTQGRTFRPLWWRTFRYVELNVVTGSEPLTVNGLYSYYTGYPFEEKAEFKSNDPSTKLIWEVGWRTARLCAHESYVDCPYYEQLQYTGDTRIQALISLYVSGDDRLMRKAIADYANSMTPEGLTQSRYPSSTTQVIPTFSLFWVSMIHDFWMHRRDDAFVKSHLANVRNVLNWFENRTDKQKNMLGRLEWWNFVDWTNEWKWDDRLSIGGVPEGTKDGSGSSTITLQYAYTLNQAADLFEAMNDKPQADKYRSQAKAMATAAYQQCYNQARGLLSDTPQQKIFSQHANIMAILAEAVPTESQKTILTKIMSDKSLIQTTLYYKFYLARALRKANMADAYYGILPAWREMLKLNLTTFAEQPDPTRSDCHAWSASPNYDLLATVCGIMPDAPGFERVKINPALGLLDQIEGRMPHPKGEIKVKFVRKGSDRLEGEISLPNGLTGRALWNGKEVNLKSGNQKVSF
jgi:alpha-L-rhamnosidase